MEETPRYRPKLWYHIDSTDLPTIGGAPDLNAIGTETEFPAPNNEQKRPPRRGRGPGGPGSYSREGQYDRGNSYAIAEEQQIEQQRQLNFNERRTIDFRGNDRRQQGPSRARVYCQQLRYRNGGYKHNNEEERHYFDHFCRPLWTKFEAFRNNDKAPYLGVFRQPVMKSAKMNLRWCLPGRLGSYDVRTPIMSRIIPNRVDFEDLEFFLDATSKGTMTSQLQCATSPPNDLRLPTFICVYLEESSRESEEVWIELVESSISQDKITNSSSSNKPPPPPGSRLQPERPPDYHQPRRARQQTPRHHC